MIRRELTDHPDIDPDRVHGPDGTHPDPAAAAAEYELALLAAEPVAVQLLGIGGNGHTGFNEPGSSLRSRTRVAVLAERTRRDNARFFRSQAAVPRRVITQGLGTICRAQHLVLGATGEGKAEAVAAAIEGPLSASCPACVLQCLPPPGAGAGGEPGPSGGARLQCLPPPGAGAGGEPGPSGGARLQCLPPPGAGGEPGPSGGARLQWHPRATVLLDDAAAGTLQHVDHYRYAATVDPAQFTRANGRVVMTGWDDDVVGETQQIVDGVVPKHEQLRAILTELATGKLAPGDILPGERRLCLDYGVSRITVRKAIESLVNEGLLVSVRGKGTFVAARTARSRLHLASFSEEMRRMGMEPSTRVLTVRREVPPSRTAEALALPADGAAFRVRRLRMADCLRISVDDGWYPAHLFPGLDTLDLTASLYRALTEIYGRRIDRAEQTVRAAEPDHEMAELLGLPGRRPVLVADRVSYSGDLAVEHAVTTYRGDRYELQMSLRDRGE